MSAQQGWKSMKCRNVPNVSKLFGGPKVIEGDEVINGEVRGKKTA